ncbi:MAG: AraC family transcriptional regulator [Verrucomicrobiota bacterium]
MSLRTMPPADWIQEKGILALNASVLETLFDEAPDVAFFVKDREGRYLVANQSLAERHGIADRKDLLGKRPSDLCSGPFGEVPTEQDARVLKTGKPITNHLEMQWLRPHRPCWCLTTKLPLHGTSGKIEGLVGFSRDLRERFALESIPPSVATVLGDFEKQPGEAVSASDLAERAELTTAQFSRLMKRVFNVTPTQHITKMRIQLAVQLLAETDRTVAEIALDSGYCDHSAFTRAFRATMGLTPSQYREARPKNTS